MKYNSLSYVILLVLMCTTIRCQDPEPTKPEPKTLELDKELKHRGAANKTENFIVNINNTYTTGEWNFFVVVMPVRALAWEKTEITIFKLDDQNKRSLQVKCSEAGVDTCLINKNKIYNNDKIYVDVKCEDDCEYRIKAYWSEAFPLKLDRSFKLDFEHEAYAKTFTIDVQGVDFQELRILLTAENSLFTSSPVHLLANYGHTAPTASKYDLKGLHMWDDGQGIFIYVKNMKEKFMTILVEGPAENILNLKVVAITHHPHNIELATPMYDYIRAQSGRTYFIDISSRNSSKNQDLLVKITVLTGEVRTVFYRDQKLNDVIATSEFGHMGDLLYKFTDAHLTKSNITEKIYMKISTPGAESTIVVGATYAQTNKPTRLATELSEISEIEKNEVDLYFTEMFVRVTETDTTNKTIQINVHNFTGQPILVFHICRTNLDDCSSNFVRNYKNQQNIRLLKAETSSSGYNSTSYRVNISTEDFSSVPDRPRMKKLTLLILVYTNSESSKYSINNQNYLATRTIREGFPIRGRASIGQKNYYRVAKLTDDAKSVEIHLMEVSGVTTMLGYRQDPRLKGASPTSIVPEGNKLIFSTDLTDKPIYIVTNGQENSLYSIIMSVKRDEKKNGSGNDNFNFVVVPENYQQMMVLQPGASEIIRIHPTSEKFVLRLSSRRQVKYCATSADHVKPVPPNCTIDVKEGINHLNNRGVMYIGISNPGDNPTRISIAYTDDMNCQSRPMGHVWRQLVQADKTVGCAKYIITKKEITEIFVHPENKRFDLLEITMSFSKVGSTFIMDKPREVLDVALLEKLCITFPCEMSIVVKTKNDTMVEMVAQQLDKQITLLDGISQSVEGSFTNKIYKNYKFHMVGKLPTSIIVEGKNGYYGFYVNIIDEDMQHKLNETKVFPTKQKHHFNSSNDYYTLYNSLFLTESNLTNVTCQRCVMLISVVLNNAEPEVYGKYIIEVTQQVRFLKEHAQALGYLDKNSMAFYQYFLPDNNRTMIVSLTTETMGCATMYLAKGDNKIASASNFIKKSKGDELVHMGQKGSYSITVESHVNCLYTISASSTGQRLYQLSNGVFKDIKLEENETAYFFYENFFDTDFKLMSLEKYGEVFIKANITTGLILQNIDNQTDISKFTWLGSKDVLSIRKKDKEFCKQCLFLFVVTALKSTHTSLIISSAQTEVPMEVRKDITDIINKDEQTTYKIFESDNELIIAIDVFFGQINVIAKSSDFEETKKFGATNKTQIWKFKQRKNDTSPMKRTHVVVVALENAMYKLSFNSTSSAPQQRKIKPGVPHYLFMTEEDECMEGMGSGPIRLILWTSDDKKQNLKTLQVKLKSNNKTYTKTQRTVEQTSLVDFTNSQDIVNGTYEICIKSSTLMSLTVIQVAKINILPQNNYVFIDKSENFSLSPNGKIILEVFECDKATSVLFSGNFGDLAGEDSQLLQFRRFGMDYLVETESYGPVFLNVNGSSRIRWMHVNQREEEGVGYYSIKPGHATYKMDSNQLIFKITPISQIGHKALNITSVTYHLILSHKYSLAKYSAHCYSPSDFNTSRVFNTNNLSDKFEIQLTKDEINRSFKNSLPDYLFSIVRANVEIKNKAGVKETYTFIYEEEQIPWNVKQSQVVKPEPVNPTVSSGFWQTLLTLAMLALAVFLFYACVRFVKIQIRRRRAQNLLKNEPQTIESSNNNDVELRYGSFAGGA